MDIAYINAALLELDDPGAGYASAKLPTSYRAFPNPGEFGETVEKRRVLRFFCETLLTIYFFPILSLQSSHKKTGNPFLMFNLVISSEQVYPLFNCSNFVN